MITPPLKNCNNQKYFSTRTIICIRRIFTGTLTLIHIWCIQMCASVCACMYVRACVSLTSRFMVLSSQCVYPIHMNIYRYMLIYISAMYIHIYLCACLRECAFLCVTIPTCVCILLFNFSLLSSILCSRMSVRMNLLLSTASGLACHTYLPCNSLNPDLFL